MDLIKKICYILFNNKYIIIKIVYTKEHNLSLSNLVLIFKNIKIQIKLYYQILV